MKCNKTLRMWLFSSILLTLLVSSCSHSKIITSNDFSQTDDSYNNQESTTDMTLTTGVSGSSAPKESEDNKLTATSNTNSINNSNKGSSANPASKSDNINPLFNNGQYMPYENIFETKTVNLVINDKINPMTPCVVTYNKREGGTYIYSNNPEMLADEDVNQAILQQKSMSGMYEFTYEHSNHSLGGIYLGYQLLNTGTTDATVTVYNIGMQVEGEWLGQQSWSDFYNQKFDLPDDYFEKDGSVSWIYEGVDFINYTPRVFKPTTYNIPAGKYIYVLGGTSADAANGTNVANTANKIVKKGKCSNAVVKFSVTGGKITGTFYSYNDIKVAMQQKEQGYVTFRNGKDYSKQYKGTDPHLGIIDSNLSWTVNDLTPRGELPVTFQTSYDKYAMSDTLTPYREYKNGIQKWNSSKWTTALNPQNSHNAIGTDMMIFNCVDTKGIARVIDNNRADGSGEPANTGNWMVQYNDNYTFVNTGSKARTFNIYTKGSISGALMVIIRDKNGNVLDAQVKVQPYTHDSLPAGANPDNFLKVGGTWWAIVDGTPYYETAVRRSLVRKVVVQPRSFEQVTVDYLNMGNSCGSIEHWVVLD